MIKVLGMVGTSAAHAEMKKVFAPLGIALKELNILTEEEMLDSIQSTADLYGVVILESQVKDKYRFLEEIRRLDQSLRVIFCLELSSQVQRSIKKDFIGRFPTQAFARSVIHFFNKVCNIIFRR